MRRASASFDSSPVPASIKLWAAFAAPAFGMITAAPVAAAPRSPVVFGAPPAPGPLPPDPRVPPLPGGSPPGSAPPVTAAPTSAPPLPGPAAPGEAAGDEPKKKKKKKDKIADLRASGEFSVRGRVYALAEYSRQERTLVELGTLEPKTEHPHSLDFSVPTARASLKYQAPQKWLSAEIELEVADGPSMKDGYVQARDKHFTAKAGQFKMPVSAHAMESLWDLPVARRGALHDLLSDWLDVGGRHPGVLFGARARGGIKPSISLGAFQGRVLEEEITSGDRNTDPVSLRGLGFESYDSGQSYVARAGIELMDALDLGAYYEHRLGSPAVGEIEHYPTAGIDAVLDSVFEGMGLRVWLDALLGTSWYVHAEKADDEDVMFLAARACAGFRVGGMLPDEPYIEPFAQLGVLEPDSDVVSDFMLESAIGVNVGYWDRARIGLQGELVNVQRNFPTGATGYLGAVSDRMGLLLQGAVTF